MAKKTSNWDKVSKDKEVLSRAEALVIEGAAVKGELPQELCDELNSLTGNSWKPAKYKVLCDSYDFPWTVQEVVYALFHKGKYPEKKQEEIYTWKTDQPIDNDQETIGFFVLCQYQNDREKCGKYEQVDVKPLNKEVLGAFAGWDIEEDWEANNYYTFRCSKKDTYGYEKTLKIYNYDFRMLNCTLINLDEQEKETLTKLLEKYYNHISSDFDYDKALAPEEPETLDIDIILGKLGEPEGPVTREYLEQNWAVSSYDEGDEEQIDYYMNEFRNAPGDKAYVYYHKDGELRELEVAHITARSDNPALYDELIKDEDVLINGEAEYGADMSAEFITKIDCYLMWFREKQA